MAKFTDIPTSVSNAGLDAEYPGPENLATITLVSCPLDPGYEWAPSSRNVVNSHIDTEMGAGRGWQSADVHSFRFEDIHLPIPYHVATRYNYMRVSQGGATWYFFATPEPHTANSTKWSLITDGWTTFMPIVRGTLLRGHYGIKMALSDTSILAEPEPVDAGELQVLAEASHDIFANGYDIMAISATNLDAQGFRDLRSELRGQAAPINMINATAGLGQGGDVFDAVDTTASGHLPGGGWPFSFLESGANYNIGYPITPDPVELPWEQRVPAAAAGGTSRLMYRPIPGGVHILTRRGWEARVEAYSHAPWVMDGLIGTNAVPLSTFPAVSGSGATRSGFEYNADNSGPVRFPAQNSKPPVDVSFLDRGVGYTRTGTQSLIPGWKSYLDDGSAVGKKLTSPQYAAIVYGDLSGQERTFSPDSIDGNTLSVAWSRTFGMRSEYSFWPNVKGQSMRPFNFSWAIGFGYAREGFASAFGPQAVAYQTDRVLSEAKYFSDIRQLAYARYSSQAKEGAFNTIINRTLGGWGGLL